MPSNGKPRKMKVGKNAGDLTGSTRKRVTTKVADARVAQAIAQSQNGFQGESLNDHGLPDGHQRREILQDAPLSTEGSKFRKLKRPTYADGTKKVTAKPKLDYQAAAKQIRGDKALYAQYKAGIQSGKAFSLTIGGKSYKYAATAAEDRARPVNGDIAKARKEEAPAASKPAKAATTAARTAKRVPSVDYQGIAQDEAPAEGLLSENNLRGSNVYDSKVAKEKAAIAKTGEMRKMKLSKKS